MEELRKKHHLELPSNYLDQFHHRVDLQLRFNDVDRLGHVNNSIYQQFYDLGRLRYFEDLLRPQILWDEVVVVLAHVALDFMIPLHLEETAAVATRVHSLEARTLHMEQLIYCPDDGRIFSRADSIMVGFDIRERCSHDLPAPWIEAILRFDPKARHPAASSIPPGM